MVWEYIQLTFDPVHTTCTKRIAKLDILSTGTRLSSIYIDRADVAGSRQRLSVNKAWPYLIMLIRA